MKTWNKHKNPWVGILTFLMGTALTGCISEEAQQDLNLQSESLSISPQVLDAKTRATSDIQLGEAKLDKLDVKILGKEDHLIRLSRQLSDATSGISALLDQGNWKEKNKLVEGETYQVVTIANAQDNLQGVNTLDKLGQKTQVDADIWKVYDPNSNAGKTFLMSSVSDYLVTASASQTITTSLSRAAAKIQVHLTVNVPGYTVGNPTWNFKNYNTATTLFANASTPTLFGDNTAKALGDMGGAYESAKNEQGTYTITTYSYATTWKDKAEETPTFIVKIPLTKVDETAEGEGKVGETLDNFYSIPVREPSQTELKRNHLYTIDANITNLGSSTEIVYGTPVDLRYDVMKWTEGEETIINADKQSYLLVTPTFHIMRNETVDNKTIHFYASDACTVKIDEVYYYDKNGTKKRISGGKQYPQINLNFAIGHSEKKDQGLVNIEAGEFVLLTVKYIKFTITSGGKSQQVTVKQYPLEYAQNIAGWYSSRNESNWITPSKAGKYSDYNGGYQAKIYQEDKKKIYNLTSYGNRVNIGSETNRHNNRMYVIQITSTNGKYAISLPQQKSDYSSDDHVVSPAFMIASQLGTVSSNRFNENSALTHCHTYREVAKDANGKEVVYDNWRLPTNEEIEIIKEYQGKTNSPIDIVLKGSHYRTISKDVISSGRTDGSSGNFVRCVRDLTPTEVTELENQKE